MTVMDLTIHATFLPQDDPDASLAFYRDTLGFEVRNDVGYGGKRWGTGGPPRPPRPPPLPPPPAPRPRPPPHDARPPPLPLIAQGRPAALLPATPPPARTLARVR